MKKTIAHFDTTTSQEEAAEFGRASQGAQLIIAAFNVLTKGRKEHGQAGRLRGRLQKIIQSDPVHGHGQRRIINGNLRLLEGFEFFNKQKLRPLFSGVIQSSIVVEKECCIVNIPVFRPSEDINYDDTYSHLVMIAAATQLDLEREVHITSVIRSDYLDCKEPAMVKLQTQLPSPCSLPVVLVFGIELYQLVRGQATLIAGGGLSLRVLNTWQPGQSPARHRIPINFL